MKCIFSVGVESLGSEKAVSLSLLFDRAVFLSVLLFGLITPVSAVHTVTMGVQSVPLLSESAGKNQSMVPISMYTQLISLGFTQLPYKLWPKYTLNYTFSNLKIFQHHNYPVSLNFLKVTGKQQKKESKRQKSPVIYANKLTFTKYFNQQFIKHGIVSEGNFNTPGQ